MTAGSLWPSIYKSFLYTFPWFISTGALCMCAGSRCLFADHASQQVIHGNKIQCAWTLTLSLLYMSVSCREDTKGSLRMCAGSRCCIWNARPWFQYTKEPWWNCSGSIAFLCRNDVKIEALKVNGSTRHVRRLPMSKFLHHISKYSFSQSWK